MSNGALPMMVSTANDITGFKIVRHLGIVRGITVRSRSVVGNLVGGLQSIFGGQIG
ncbi:MAG TPA: heavy metal-binding domain-containing protein, partial [Methylocella sp.]|nr:heavy metal-binding domain-containing protein [Methylocella sp.]